MLSISESDLAKFPAAPRSLTLAAKIQTILGQGSLAFGAIFFLFGLFFVRIFMTALDLDQFKFLGKNTISVPAVVEQVESTGITSGSKGNSEILYTVHYSFDVEGQKYFGQDIGRGSNYTSGMRSTVDYVQGDPQLNKLADEGSDWLSLILFIFPLMGGLFIIFTIARGVKAFPLLINGQLTDAELKDMQDTGVMINKIPQVKCLYVYKSKDGNLHEVIIKRLLTGAENNAKVDKLLYDPQNPDKKCFLLRDFKGLLKVNSSNQLDSGLFTALVLLAVMVVVLVGPLALFLYK